MYKSVKCRSVIIGKFNEEISNNPNITQMQLSKVIGVGLTADRK